MNTGGVGRMGLAVFAFLYPFITITARREEPGNTVAFTALCIAGICCGFFIWTSISPNRITAVGSTVRVATFLSVAIFFYVSFLIIATYGMQFYLLPLAVTWAAILSLLFRPNLLEDLCGKPVRQSLSALILVILTACLLTFFQHTSIPGSFFRRTGLVTFFCCVGIFLTTVLFLQDEKSHKNVVRALLIGSGVIGVLGILQFYDPWQAMSRWFPELQRDPRAIGTMGQANWFGTYLCLLLPLAIIELFTSTKTVGRFYFAALSGLLYAALVVCQTRGAWVSFSVFMLWLFIRQRSCRGKTLRLLLLFVVITVALVWSGNGKISSRWATLDDEIGNAKNFSPSTGSRRFAFWKFAIENLPAHVFLGSGLDTYELLSRPESGKAPTDKAHSIYFEYALTIGLPGLAAYLLFLWFCTTPPAGGSGNLRAWGFRASIGTYLLQGIFIHDTIRTWPLVWLIAGLAVTYRRMQGNLCLSRQRHLDFPIETSSIIMKNSRWGRAYILNILTRLHTRLGWPIAKGLAIYGFVAVVVRLSSLAILIFYVADLADCSTSSAVFLTFIKCRPGSFLPKDRIPVVPAIDDVINRSFTFQPGFSCH